MSKTATLVLVALIAALAGGAWWWRSQQPAQAPAAVAPPAAPASAPASPSAAASEPAIRYPVEAPTAAPLTPEDLPAALATLLGRKALSTFFQSDDFARRFVATVDNLGRAHAPSIIWPVTPTTGRFMVEEADGATVIAADNSSRYTPFVLLVETVDTGRAVDLYVRMYPLLQQAYRDLGFPKGYFNDRLIQVIDLLLATPEVTYPVKLHLTEVKGPIPSERPWVRYEYADPALEQLAAGQKILLRVGPVNARRLKAKLAEARQQLTRTPPTR
jgi:hypothetical protein